MKKIFKFILIPIFVLVGIGYGVYYIGSDVASEKISDKVSSELDKNGQREEVKKYIESDPELKRFVTDAKSADTASLPFKTKEEATRVLIKKIGISKLHDIQSQAMDGTLSKKEVLKTLQTHLTDE